MKNNRQSATDDRPFDYAQGRRPTTDEIGQLMIIGFEGTKPTPELIDFVRDEKIGGVIIFTRNYETPRQLKRLIKELRDAAGGCLLVGVDQEGGRVIRLGEPFTQFPSMAEIAKKGEDEAYKIGHIMAQELLDVGINLNFAPVLDVVTNAFNTVIGDRSFGSDPFFVAKLGLKLMRGLMHGGVMACGKHFPGHGDTDLDSHHDLPVINHTMARLEVCELIPFQKAIEAGIPSIMTAHILAPNLDKKYPASISKKITTGLLRKKMGFEGLIFTDDLLMKGISNQMPLEEAAVRALTAGADMIMICNDIKAQKEVLEGLRKSPLIHTDLISEKLKRINTAKDRL